MHQAVEQPLGVYLSSPAEAEAFETASMADVGEHRLHDSQPARVVVAPTIGVDLAFHLRGIGLVLTRGAPGEEHQIGRASCRERV